MSERYYPLRIRFWYWVHNSAESIWHWVWRAKLSPWHKATETPMLPPTYTLFAELDADGKPATGDRVKRRIYRSPAASAPAPVEGTYSYSVSFVPDQRLSADGARARGDEILNQSQ